MTETVLVIGGTGELGAPVAGQLHSDGYRVRVLARRLPAARDHDLEYVKGNLDDTDALRSALSGCAAVHLSARGGPPPSPTLASSAADQLGSRNWPPRPALVA
jgi:uncharacterized protein YbjT (DUF2867 family)